MKEQKRLTRVTMNFPTKLLNQLKEEAQEIGVPYSNLIITKLNERQEQIEITKLLASTINELTKDKPKKQ